MLRVLKSSKVIQGLLMIFWVVSLCIPLYYSKSNDISFPDYILNVFIALIVSLCLFQFKDLKIKKEKIFAFLLIICGVVYNVLASYVNLKYLHWYSNQINITISFGFFIVLLLSERTDKEILTDKVIRFFIHTIIVSNVIAVFVFLKGIWYVSMLNGKLELLPIDHDYYEIRYYWIYHHKSAYAFILVLSIALMVKFSYLFKNKITFLISVSFTLACIVLTHTYTALGSVIFIFLGQIMDSFCKKKNKISPKLLLGAMPVVGLLSFFVWKLAQERDITSLGGRRYIWKEAIAFLKDHFWGVGLDFRKVTFYVDGLYFEVDNCHNVFLNHMMRYSIPVGICFTLIFAIIIIATIIIQRDFLTVGIWGACLISLNMDYCLVINALPIFLLIIYCFGVRKNQRKSEKIESRN